MYTKFKSGYEAISESSIAKGEKNDCVVRAVMNSFDVNYDRAHKWCEKKLDREPRKGVFGTVEQLTEHCNKKTTLNGKVIKEILLSPKEISCKKWHPKKFKKAKPLINSDYTHKQVAYTVRTFSERFTKGTYLVLVRGHALTVKDGILFDNPYYKNNGFRRPVRAVFKVEEIG